MAGKPRRDPRSALLRARRVDISPLEQREFRGMQYEVGERVVAESESTERPARHGEIAEVLRAGDRERYRIRWDDGHESIYAPAAGALHREADVSHA